MYQTMAYDEQLKMKSRQVKALLDAAIKDGQRQTVTVTPTISLKALSEVLCNSATEIKWSFLSATNLKTVPFL